MDKKYTVTIQFGPHVMCYIQTDDPNLQFLGAVNGWGDSIMNEVQIQVTKNEETEVQND